MFEKSSLLKVKLQQQKRVKICKLNNFVAFYLNYFHLVKLSYNQKFTKVSYNFIFL